MSYEIVLAGSIASDNLPILKAIQERLSLHTDLCTKLHQTHLEFHLQATAPNRSLGATNYPTPDGSPLRAIRDLTIKPGGTRGTEWTIFTYLKPIRQFTKAVVRPAATIHLLTGDAYAFASALGYKLHAIRTRKGYLFTKTNTAISLFQYEATDPSAMVIDSELEPTPNTAPWHIEVIQTQLYPPGTKTPATQFLQGNVESVVAIAALMKGLVDLVPPDS